MPMPWFKIYDEAQNDVKLETLTDAQHRVWFKLMCFANKQAERGTIPEMKPRLLALQVARGDEALLTETLEVLSELEMLGASEDGGLTWLHWAKRQAVKPSDEPEAIKQRVTRYRERRRNAQQGDSNNVKRDVTRYTPDVTPIEREKEEEVDQEQNKRERGTTSRSQNISSSQSLEPELFDPSDAPRIATKVPAQWPVAQADIAMAGAAGWRGTKDQLQQVANDFVDYCKTNGKMSSDWEAEFRRWVRREVKMYRGSAPAGGGGKVNGKHPPPSAPHYEQQVVTVATRKDAR